MNKFGIDVNTENVQTRFDEIDLNKGGMILFDEFITWINTQWANSDF